MLVLPLLALVQVVLAVLVWRLFGGKGHWPGAVGRLTLAASAWSGTPGAAQALPMAEGPSPSRGS
jgi:hypothetical protein